MQQCQEKIHQLSYILDSYKIPAVCSGLLEIGQIDRFQLTVGNNFRFNKLNSISRELMLGMKSYSLPTYSINNGFVNIDLINRKLFIPTLTLAHSIKNKPFNNEIVPAYIGLSQTGEPIVFDITKNPHLLIGGATGSGKSTLLHNLIFNILKYSEAELLIIDTKGVEFNSYTTLNKRATVINTINDSREVLNYLIYTMEKRFNILKNDPNKLFKPIIFLIDEFADLIMQFQSKDLNILLCRILQKCRAANIYGILATQRPSFDILTGNIKANFPARISLKTASSVDSKVIINKHGAENLNIGQGLITNYKFNLNKIHIFYSNISDINEALETSA